MSAILECCMNWVIIYFIDWASGGERALDSGVQLWGVLNPPRLERKPTCCCCSSTGSCRGGNFHLDPIPPAMAMVMAMVMAMGVLNPPGLEHNPTCRCCSSTRSCWGGDFHMDSIPPAMTMTMVMVMAMGMAMVMGVLNPPWLEHKPTSSCCSSTRSCWGGDFQLDDDIIPQW